MTVSHCLGVRENLIKGDFPNLLATVRQNVDKPDLLADIVYGVTEAMTFQLDMGNFGGYSRALTELDPLLRQLRQAHIEAARFIKKQLAEPASDKGKIQNRKNLFGFLGALEKAPVFYSNVQRELARDSIFIKANFIYAADEVGKKPSASKLHKFPRALAVMSAKSFKFYEERPASANATIVRDAPKHMVAQSVRNAAFDSGKVRTNSYRQAATTLGSALECFTGIRQQVVYYSEQKVRVNELLSGLRAFVKSPIQKGKTRNRYSQEQQLLRQAFYKQGYVLPRIR